MYFLWPSYRWTGWDGGGELFVSFFFAVLHPSGGNEFEGRMYCWIERLDGRGRRGRRGIWEDNILVFDRKLKIVEIFSAERKVWVGSSLSSSHDVFLFFPLSPSVYLLILFPEMQSSYRRIVAKGTGKSIHLLQNMPQGQTWTVQQERETFTLTQHPAGQ